jgi:phage I-like protein
LPLRTGSAQLELLEARPAELERLDATLLVELATGEKGEPPTEFRIFKAGENRTRKGVFLFEKADADRVMQKAAEFGADYSIDFGHSMFSFFGGGDPAEQHAAAGWFKPEVRAGDLWATAVTWTEKADQKIRKREFRYISPTFNRSEDGHIEELLNVALTNIPATNGLRPLVASQAPAVLTSTPEPKPMNPKLLALLGLAATATEAEALEALTKLAAKATSSLDATLATLTGKGSAGEQLGTLMAWKASSEQVTALSSRVQELEAAQTKGEIKALLDAAVSEGKVAPAQVAHLSALPTETLKAFLSAAPAILPRKPAQEPRDGDSVVTLSNEDLRVAQMMGTDTKKLAKERLAARGMVVLGESVNPGSSEAA